MGFILVLNEGCSLEENDLALVFDQKYPAHSGCDGYPI